MTEKEMKRKRVNAAARERRRKRRKRAVMVERIVIALIGVVILVGGTVIVWNMMPDIKVARQLNEADEYAETQAYDEAIASCEEALKIDSTSVEAYRSMAGIYLTKEDWEAAEQVLYRGWESTQDESLLKEYCVYLLNDAVEDINAGICTLDTLDKCIQAIEKNPDSEDCYNLLNACYGRLFMSEGDELFCNGTGEESCIFNHYLTSMNQMLQIYESTGKEELKAEIIKYAQPQNETLWLEVEHLQEYKELLDRVAALDTVDTLQQLDACVEKAIWAQDIFAQAFTIFQSGDFEPIKDFMQSEEYIAIRDQFMDGTMDYWYGKTYIPVSREKLKLYRIDGEWNFSFADFDECPETEGVIKIWGVKQDDGGVQRLSISYEPASENGEYFPHTAYEFMYLYSNVRIKGVDVPQMNYRFETRTETPEGTVSEVIGDWGGEHEWQMEY